MKKIFLLLLLLASVLTGCGQEQQATTVAEHTVNNSSQVNLAAFRPLAPGPKDAYYCSKILGVWESLITRGPDGRPAPGLATSWEMHDGGREWIFKLRQDVNFHNGTHFTADSVLKNFDRMKIGYKSSYFYGMRLESYYPSIIKYEALDDYTIRLVFAKPSINQLYKMINFGSPVFAPECFDAEGNFNGFAIGTGPYKITENVLGKYVKLERFEGYYGKKGKIPCFIIRNIPNADVRYAALKAGEVMGVLDINAIPPFLAEEIKKDDRFAISSNKSSMIRFLHLNGSKFPFNDVRMRQAVSLAINRDNLVQAMYLNYAVPTSNVLNYTSPYYKDIPVEYNLAKAQRLAAEVLQGKRCQITYCINGGETLQKGEAELIAYWLKDIGLDVTIKSQEYATMMGLLRHGEYGIARVQQGLANGDPYGIFYTFMMPDGSRNATSSSHYRNAEVIQLMTEVQFIEDEDKRRAIYDRLQEISVQEQPVVPLFNDKSVVAHSRHLKNYDALIYGINLAEIEWVD